MAIIAKGNTFPFLSPLLLIHFCFVFLKAGDTKSNESTKTVKDVLSEVAGHARRIAFIFADELKAPPKVSRHLGESDGEHEAYRVIEDLYEFFKRLYDKSIRKCHSEEASSEGTTKYFPYFAHRIPHI